MGYPAVIVDIDGTVANNAHRIRLIPDWDAYNAQMHKDTPIEATCKVVRTLAWHYKILMFTGRPVKFSGVTEKWLRANDLPYDELRMRRPDDRRADWVVKREWLERVRFDGRFGPFLAIEDRAQVVAMWRAAGLVCFQVAEGDY